ncbi:DUF2169 family type VI secretion system accessory protein [Sorangium cellulosum]|uniref:DUF2169 domain-containing protein n=1 Tax=Sorangium cellulosum So0157-2 TaxID=1254432 RepID=S4YCZ6_SORCE|nr:DUF2169 domain-containing protein [Sorangium cellulosum]AGP42295.1 hypothetical protein SCE1572_52035 [Sorangium cellulosum So0157-2]
MVTTAMDVVSHCPLPIASVVWQPRPATWMLTVVCKATFLLRPGEAVLAREQEPPHEDDQYWHNDARRSLRAACDLVPVKPRADVVLVGHAFAPGGEAVRSLIARLNVGEVDKSVAVFCDRAFGPDGTLQEGQKFSRLPLIYERAAGGPDTFNPVGLRTGMQDAQGRVMVPNLQPPGVKVTSRSDVIEPIGFGPLAPTWPIRREKLGRKAAQGSVRDWYKQPLPEDIDFSCFNHAPQDQQIKELRDDARIALENLHAEHPRLVTSLPGVRPRAVLERAKGAPQPLTLRCDTLWIDTDRSVCTLTWRAQVPIEHPQERGRVLFELAQAGPSSGWHGGATGRAQTASQPRGLDVAETAAPAAPSSDDEESFAGTMAPGVVPPAGMALPFAPSGHASNLGGAPPAQSPPRPLSQSSSGWGAAAPPPVPAPPGSAPSLSQLSPSWESGTVPISQPPAPRRGRTGSEDSDVFIAPSPPPPPRVVPPAVVDSAAPAHESSPWAAEPRGGQPAPMTVGQRAAHVVSPEVVKAEPAPVPAARPAPAPTPRIEAGTALQFIWYDPEEVPRIRRRPSFQQIIRELEEKPLDAEVDDPAVAEDPMAVEDRREVFEVLARGEATDEAGLSGALELAIRGDGKFVAPLLLVAGELCFPFDELDRLKATMTTAAPFAAGDEVLSAAVEEAKSFLSMPHLLSPPAVAEGFTKRIEDAFARAKRSVPQAYLGEQAERVLLERRCYQRRAVFGATHLRALLQVGGSSRLVPAYLPEDLAKKLPMQARFRARVIAALELQEDHYEAYPAALRVTALVRLIGAPRR